MKLLALINYDDIPYLPRLQQHLSGHQTVLYNDAVRSIGQLKLLLEKSQADAIICSDEITLATILGGVPDYVPSASRKKLTLENYAGSLLSVRSLKGDRQVPALVINPLEHQVTKNYGTFLLKRYLSKILEPGKWPVPPKFQYKVVGPADAQAVIERCAAARLLAVDIETPYPDNPYRAINCVGYAAWFIETNTIECYVFPFLEPWAAVAVSAINGNDVPKLTQNGLYDNVYMMRWRAPLNNWLHDTYHLFHSWYSELPKRLGFIAPFAIRDIRYWKDDGSNGLEAYYRYNARDCWATLVAHLSIVGELPSWAARNYLIEFPLVFPCLTCELEGVAIDEKQWTTVQGELNQAIEDGRTKIQTMLGAPEFNPNSPAQVKKLFQVLGLGHLPDTGKASMLKAKASSPFNEAILTEITDWKEDAKLISSYLKDAKIWNGRIHYKIDPGKTDTSRLASTASSYDCGWNIQNVPRGETVKSCVVADSGWALAEVDGEQAEARWVGYLSGDMNLITLVESTKDYHSWNAQAFFGVPYEEIYNEATKKTLNKEIRDLSKRTNHGANYNMGAAIMLATMGPKFVLKAKTLLKLPITMTLLEVCQLLLDRYAQTYPGVKSDWYQWIITTIKSTNKLVSAIGQTRFFFGDPSKSKLALNAAVAHGPQNGSVGQINKGFYATWREQFYGELIGRIRIKAQIHDSVFFQYRVGDLEAARRVIDLTTVPIPVTDCHGITRTLAVPMAISYGDAETGTPALRWSDCK